MTNVRQAARSAAVMGALLVVVILAPRLAAAQSRCDPSGDGVINDTDGVQVLRAAAQLSSSCGMASCDVNGDGAINDVDGVNVLRAAASLPSDCDDTGPPPGDAFGACEDNCQAAQELCDAFFDDYDSVADCREEPQSTLQNRPLIDRSKPANGTGPRRGRCSGFPPFAASAGRASRGRPGSARREDDAQHRLRIDARGPGHTVAWARSGRRAAPGVLAGALMTWSPAAWCAGACASSAGRT